MKFLRISSCPYDVNSLQPSEPSFLTYQNFANSFYKGHPRNNSVKLFQNLTNHFRKADFLRISSVPFGAINPPPLSEPCFLTNQNSVNSFEKGPQKYLFFEII